MDKNSAVWVTSIPTCHLRAGPREFREITATYFGVPSPLASSLVGQSIFSNGGARRGLCDPFGLKLVSAKLDNRWTEGHDQVKFAIAASLDMLKVSYTCEVHGVFTPAIPPHAQASARRFMQGRRARDGRGARQGLVPDFKVALSRLVDGAAETDALAEVKMLRCGSTTANPVGGSTYATSGDRNVLAGRQRAVTWRAGRVQPERERDARKIDVKYNGTAIGDDGPVLRRLRTFGPIVDLVVGHFGEWSSGLERLLAAAAEDAAPRSRALFGARSPSDSRGRCAWFFRREVAWAGLNANARLKLERAGFVAWDARSAAARREERARQEDARRATAAWAQAAYEARPARNYARDRDAAG